MNNKSTDHIEISINLFGTELRSRIFPTENLVNEIQAGEIYKEVTFCVHQFLAENGYLPHSSNKYMIGDKG